MVWGAFVGSSISNLVVIPSGENKAVDFIEVVYKGELLGFLWETPNAFLMEDGALIHCARVSKAWREEHSIKSFMWPAQYPDLNPIENVWSLLKNAVHYRRIRPRTVKGMMVALNEERRKYIKRTKVVLPGGNTLFPFLKNSQNFYCRIIYGTAALYLA